MKELFTKFRFTILTVGIVLVLVIFRMTDGNLFKNGAEKNALPALSGENIMQPSDPKFLADNTLLVYIDNPKFKYATHSNFMDVESDHLLDRDVVKELKRHEGNIVLMADNDSVKARAWMLLAQKGVKNCYIALVNSGERFNHQFEPDTSVTQE